MIIQTTKQMRERDNFDHYPTPIKLCAAALRQFPHANSPSFKWRILDPGAGTGVWGEAARQIWPSAEIHGLELRDVEPNKNYDHWLTGNYMLTRYKIKFDFIIGNPPYSDLWEMEQRRFAKEAKARGEKYKRPPRPADQPKADAQAFITKALTEVFPEYGYVIFLLRLAFLEGQKRSQTFWPKHCPSQVLTLGRRPSFTGNGKTDSTAYSLYYWTGVGGRPQETYSGGWLKW